MDKIPHKNRTRSKIKELANAKNKVLATEKSQGGKPEGRSQVSTAS